MDKLDKDILNEIQSDFPIVSHPYQVVAERLKLPENEVLDRVKALKEKGIIRRIGGNFHSNRLNFKSTLCAAKVPEKKLDSFVATVNGYPGVTHNYLRNHVYNVWFTFIAEDMSTIGDALDAITEETGVKEILNLPAIQVFKIKVDFEV
ncbi:MAG: AsnC family transcriptional regulator [Desulfatiglandaceae bacterium]